MTIRSLFFLFILGFQGVTAQPLPAFRGAEGGGRYTSGGRGGAVLVVDRLDDDGKKGSLRWALKQTFPRTIVFAVSGTIELQKELEIKWGNVTIAGQTAPGDGICLKDYPVRVEADNVIIRYLRFRMGDLKGVEEDALGGRFCKNIIIDHCSISWSTDECASFYGNVDFTMQWCMVSESLNSSVHQKGAHGYGAIWGGKNASFHHNLLVHHNSRNARFDHPDIYKSVSPTGEYRGHVEFVNNVVYNWMNHAAYGGEAGCFNLEGNYYKPGPATRSKDFFLEPYSEIAQPGKFYLKGNVLEGAGAVARHNSRGVKWSNGLNPDEVLVSTPFEIQGAAKVQTAREAYGQVLDKAGASRVRDAVDLRLIEEVRRGTATYKGSISGKPGIIDSQHDVGGWPELKSGTAPTDRDGDGIPDEWELRNGLNPQDKADGASLHPHGYTWLEVYLDELAEPAGN